MRNGSSASTPDEEETSGGLPKSVRAKIRVMTKFTQDHRLRVEERAALYKALAELKEDRRRLSYDLEQERLEREAKNSALEIDIGYGNTDKPSWTAYENEKDCALCGNRADRSKEIPCRICPRIFHKLCLSKCGECRDADLQAAEAALTNAGWSCYNCGNLSLLLTDTEINRLIDEFDMFDKNKDALVSWEEFIAQVDQSEIMSAGRRRPLSTDEELETRLDFKIADQDNDDGLDWWEFLNHHARILLATRPKEELVKLLTEKEVIKCRTLFQTMDSDHDGVLTLLEAKQAIRKSCQRFERGVTQEELSKLSPRIDLHSEIRAQLFVDAENLRKESIAWPEFLQEQALYIICTRPNVLLATIERVIHDAHLDD